LYALLTDLQPPVVRATILIITICVSRLLGRTQLGFNTLSLAGIIVLIQNPLSLFLAGTQLSFLAVAAMIHFQPLLLPRKEFEPLDHLIARTRPWYIKIYNRGSGSVWRVFLVGAMIWTISFPLVWHQWGLISPIGL